MTRRRREEQEGGEQEYQGWKQWEERENLPSPGWRCLGGCGRGVESGRNGSEREVLAVVFFFLILILPSSSHRPLPSPTTERGWRRLTVVLGLPGGPPPPPPGSRLSDEVSVSEVGGVGGARRGGPMSLFGRMSVCRSRGDEGGGLVSSGRVGGQEERYDSSNWKPG